MTLTKLKQIYGIRVTRIELYKWIVDHPDSKWYKQGTQAMKNVDTTIEQYVNTPIDRDDIYPDADGEFITAITRDFYSPASPEVEIYPITHDLETSDVIVGICVMDINLAFLSESSVPVDFKFPVTLDFEPVYIRQLETHSFTANREPNYYMVQNDCVCCS